MFCAKTPGPDGRQTLSIDWFYTQAAARLPEAERAGPRFDQLARDAAAQGLVPISLRSSPSSGGALLSLSEHLQGSHVQSAPTPTAGASVRHTLFLSRPLQVHEGVVDTPWSQVLVEGEKYRTFTWGYCAKTVRSRTVLSDGLVAQLQQLRDCWLSGCQIGIENCK